MAELDRTILKRDESVFVEHGRAEFCAFCAVIVGLSELCRNVQVRVCTREQFYGPAGVEAMKRSGELYAEHRNDNVLVLVSGCVVCPLGFNQRSMLTSCYQEWESVSAIEIRTPIGSTAPIPFIIGAVFSERRCPGLFSKDALRMEFFSHYLLLENVQCVSFNRKRIYTEDYENRALEYIFETPLDLSKTDRNLRMTQIWGVPPDRGQSKLLKLSDIDCGRVLANDSAYIEERTQSEPLTFANAGSTLAVDCATIRSRYHFDSAEQKYKNEKGKKTDFPLAFIRLVYKDYLFIEMEFASSYAPQNYYCYAIDKKSSITFHRQIHSLAICFPNVFVVTTEKEYAMDSKGHNLMKSSMECMKLLVAKKMEKWKYVILLQNDDVQMKTNDEMVQIFKWMNGVSDIQYTRIGSTHIRFEEGDEWSLSTLKLFKNETKNKANKKLKKNKGQFEMSLSREFVEWLLNDLEVSIMLDKLNSFDYASDEYFIQTLAANEFMGAPGGFTGKCFDKELAPGFTRMTLWLRLVSELCQSGIQRHGICILGLKDLVPNLSGNNPFLFANKMQMGEDAEAIQCWHETMYNRTYLAPTLERLNKSFFTELPQVRYNLEKKRPNFDVDKFDCRYAFIDEVKFYQELKTEYRKVIKSYKSAEDFEFCVVANDDSVAETEQNKSHTKKMMKKEL
ncbi:hypothetical protein niasHS_010050 [Heterodera schachtii]|uniref:Uncharacterized protein n=1 Tax=Heterodera schachtii TaxID=97005 RepID=A0ABD2J073_HETSC